MASCSTDFFNYFSELDSPFHLKDSSNSKIVERDVENFYTQLRNKIFTTFDISSSEITTIIDDFKLKLDSWKNIVQTRKHDLHLRTSQTGLPIIIELNQAGDIILPLKTWGEKIGEGKFRKVGQALLVSHSRMPLVAHITQTFHTELAREFSNSEVRILQIIRQLRKTDSKAKGLLIKFYGFVDYHQKHTAPVIEEVKTNVLSPQEEEGYDNKLIDSPSEKENPIVVAPLQKRALVMKLYTGGNLEQNIHKLTLANKLRVAYFLLSSLDILHSAGIFHSDLKPDNIFLETDPKTGEVLKAVIGDFGFACNLNNPADCFFKNGYKSYRAPELKEMLKGTKLNPTSTLAADIFSMGQMIGWMFQNEQHTPTWLASLVAQMKSFEPAERPTANVAFTEFQKENSLQSSRKRTTRT